LCVNAPSNCLGGTPSANPAVAASWTTASSTTNLTAKCAGTANNITISGTGTGTTGTADEEYTTTAASTNGTTSGSNFALPSPNNNGTLSANINSAIGTSGAAGFSKSYTSPTITLTASSPGSTGITAALDGSVTGVNIAVTTTGSNGNGTAPSFQYWSGAAAVTPAQLAANIAGAITSAEQTANGISLSYTSSNTYLTITGAGSNAGAAGNTVPVGGTLTGFAWTNGGATSFLKGGSGLIWTFQSASNGQTTAPQPTGTSGIIIDNAGAATGEANIYFGTLSGTGATNSGIKMSQAGLK
jgi:hypothetical protein